MKEIQTNIGSSETTRENYPGFFISWFIGFSEGDGSFIVNKDTSLEFKVTQSSTDAQVLFYIKKSLGFGRVSKQDNISNTHHYRVRDEKHLLTIINIFNGNIVLDYVNVRFKLFIEAYNKRYGTNIEYIPNYKSSFLNDGWLSGFTDAEGCFTVSIIERSYNYTQVQVRYILSQKAEHSVFERIALEIKGKLSYLSSYDGLNLTVNLLNLKTIINYFSLFPLKTKKYITYFNWLRIYKLVLNKEHFTEKGLNEIKRLKGDKI